MDARKLETTRIAALQHVQRCTPTCPSSTSCRFRHARRKLRERGKPCTHARAWYTRFALKVPRIYGCSLYTCAFGTADPRGLAQAANDAVLFELLLDRRTRCQAGSSAFAEEASKALRPGPLNGRPRQRVAKNRSRSQGPSSMRLAERKHILIDIHRALHHGAIFASPPAHLSLDLDSVVERGCRVQLLGLNALVQKRGLTRWVSRGFYASAGEPMTCAIAPRLTADSKSTLNTQGEYI